MRLSLSLAAILLTGGASLASASTWTAPDSTRPAPWGSRAPASSVVIPWSMTVPVGVDPVSGEPIYANPGYSDPWTDGDRDRGGGGEGIGDGGPGPDGPDGPASCGGPDAGGGGSCGPGGNGF